MRLLNRPALRRVVDPLQEFLHAETAGGMVLLAATVVALVWANSPLGGTYAELWEWRLPLGPEPLGLTMDLHHWVNDGLMVVFFFVVGLEIKRELVTGELRHPRRAALPALAALGGVVVPAVIFLALNAGGPGQRGWGIPMATDIAFAVGALSLLGSRVPAGAKLFLLTLAIVDDIVAILVIAVFYTERIEVGWLALAAGGLGLVVALRRLGVRQVSAYLPVGLLVWLATLASGVHATIAGVALGLLTPAHPVGGRRVLEELERRLHPLSSYLVVPVFALANAGVPLGGAALAEAAGSRVSWGIAIGLAAGKLLGVSAATVAGIRLRLGELPTGMGLRHLWGVAAVAGIGFTVSLLISDLAYDDPALGAAAKVGILAGSLASALAGLALLTAISSPDRKRR